MASNLVQGFLKTLETIGNSPHPYSAIADYITTVSLLPRRPVWAEVLSVGNLLASIFMICVATLTCATQIRNKRFTLGCVTQDYIVRPNAAICFAIGCIGYSALSIAEIWLEIVQEQSPRDINARGRAALTGIKGFCLWEGAWCFSWTSAGQFICAKWRPPWQADSSYNRIPRLVVWTLNSTFILMAILAAGFPLVAFIMIEYREKESLSLVTSVVKKLRMMDRDPETSFQFTTALLVMKPLFQLLPTLDSIILLLRIGTMAWLCTLVVAMLAQAALIGFSLSYQHEMGTTCSIWNTLLQMLMLRSQDTSSTSSALDYFRERNLTVILSATILFTGTSFIPVVIWQYCNTRLENFTSVSYWLVLDLSSSCILSVVVNVVMFATLKQIIRFSEPTSNSKNHTIISSDEIRMQRCIWSVAAHRSQIPQVDLDPNSSAPVVESTVDIPAKSSQADTSDRSNSDLPTAGKIETVNDSREPMNSHRNHAKRVGNNGTNGNRNIQGVFNQALGGLKRSGGTDILKDTPPHRRLRSDEPFSSGGIPTGPRSMDRDSRDGGRPNVIPPRIGGGMATDRRDTNNNGPRPPHNNFPPMRPGFGGNSDVGAKSILERVGVMGNGIRPFVNHNFQGGFDNGQPRRMNDQLVDSLNGGRPSMPPALHAPFYNPGAPYSGPMTPNHPFLQHQYQQPSPNAPTPQLFLANGQPFIPSHPIPHPLSAAGGQIPPMYHQVLMNVPTTPNSGLSAQSPAFNPGQSMGYVPKSGASQSQSATPDLNLSPLPDKPSLRQECKYNLECKDAWCPSSHCSPCGDFKSSMLLNFDACEKQLQCQDSECPKAHVSPQQREPKSSIRIPVITNAAAPNTSAMPLQASTPAPSSNLTPCRFGTQCTRADCHFTHPWNTNPNTPGSASEVGKAPASTPFSTIRCKYGMACTRPNCHFQHPPKKTAAASYRTPSKNISKTFNSSDIVTAANGIDAVKLPPSKKFAASQPEQAESLNNADEKAEKESAAPTMSLKPKVEADLPVSNPSSNSANPSIKTEANNGLQHQAASELTDIKPILPVSVST